MAQNRPDSVLTLTGFPPLVPNVPANWPTRPTPNKISLLWQYNFHELYHKFSPFTNYHDSLLTSFLPDKQPFVYKFIDEAQNTTFNQLPSTVKTLASAVNINQDTLDDVVRVGKFLISSHGVQFLASQILIQRLQPFDETRIYNPLSPILATITPLTLGLGGPPIRHIESGLLGLANSITSVIGINFQTSYQTPSSTAGPAALSDYNTGQGKGLVRGSDASKGYAQLKVAWPVSSNPSNGVAGGLTGMLSMVASAATQLFGSTPKQPTGTIFRGDESTYTMMAISPRIDISQNWFANSKNKSNQPKKSTSLLNNISNITNTIVSIASNPLSIIGNALGSLFSNTGGARGGPFIRKKIIALPNGFIALTATTGLSGQSITGRPTGYIINDGDRYGNDVGKTGDGDLQHSDILVQFSYYANATQKYDSKFDDSTSDKVKSLSDTLKSVINGINGNQPIGNFNNFNTPYIAKTNTYSRLLSSGDPKSIGYDNLFDTVPQVPSPLNTYGVIEEYYTATGRLPSALDKRVNPNKNLRFATTFTSDGMNQLPILKGERGGSDVIGIPIEYDANLAVSYRNWEKYKPYEDDLIAFFFYDIVNQKYIPFRATVKGISEGNTAFWDELRFIGRADQLYNYSGFSRNLSFSFNIVINSISELLPTWKKIGYLASAVKPSNYTRSETIANKFDRFMVPPMFMITIGDLYRFQPMAIRNVNINIPDDALWETLNQYNSDEWSYLNGIIKNPQIQGQNSSTARYGQFPREAEINIEGFLLEKERAQVGGSHFGHAPRIDEWESKLLNGNLTDDAFVKGGPNAPFLPDPSFMHKQMITALPTAAPDAPITPATIQKINRGGQTFSGTTGIGG